MFEADMLGVDPTRGLEKARSTDWDEIIYGAGAGAMIRLKSICRAFAVIVNVRATGLFEVRTGPAHEMMIGREHARKINHHGSFTG